MRLEVVMDGPSGGAGIGSGFQPKNVAAVINCRLDTQQVGIYNEFEEARGLEWMVCNT